jgi:hypothetical protein
VFERAWRSQDVDGVLSILAPDVELTSTAPFRPRDGLRGGPARSEVAELCAAVSLDLTRKQLTRERATWTVRVDGAADRRGRVEAEIVGGRVTRLRLGPAA